MKTAVTCVIRGLCLLSLAFAEPALAMGQTEPAFNRNIRPILSDKCFACHGPDSATREADLRLDVRDVAVEFGAIVPHQPDDSEILRRITSTDPDVQMPPPASKLGRLDPQEIRMLQEWIAQGARYEDHWAFIPPDRTVLGKLTSSQISAHIDQVVSARLQQRGLALQPPASRSALTRRLSFDITGLPPTPEEVQAFMKDDSPDAVEKLVDRLLASPAYGERMTVDWLDVARYSDSFGFQVDREREMWPWRDWVIRAFNDNMPFDQFLTWQLAGDLLPDPTDEQILATAFNRLHQQEAEGGSVEEEYRVEYVCDRVQTFATTFLGLTFECCRCHDHKYDPIPQTEYYQLFAMFQNIDEAGLYSYFTQSAPTPALTLTNADAASQLDMLSHTVSELEQTSAALRESRRADFDTWLDSSQRSELHIAPPESGRFQFESLDGGQLVNDVAADQPAKLHGGNQLVPGQSGLAVKFTGDDPVDLPFGNFQRHQPFSVTLWLKTPDVKERAVVFHRSRAWTDAASRGYELLIEDGRLKWSLIHFWPGNAASIAAVAALPVDEWVHVAATSDGSSTASGLRLFVNGRPAEVQMIRDHLTRQITGGGGDTIALGERFRDSGFKEGLIDDFRVFTRQLSQLEALQTFQPEAATALLQQPTEQLTDDQRQLLFEHFLLTIDQPWSKHLQALEAARAALGTLHDAQKEIMVMRELPQPKKAYVLFRGEYNQRRGEVTAGTPAALSPFPEDAPKNRLGLAQWLVDPQHPLTARVTVNRVWQNIFGRGLVKTAEDFGSQGHRPLYPEVLDGLSLSFIDSGWNVKQLVKSIVLTQTYQQHSVADPQTMEDDPENDWLARGPRIRLSAEMIRDNALAAAGLLKTQIGGPPVHPYELTEAFKPAKISAGDDIYRRSLYTNWRRTGPPPAMIAFDAPRRAVCTSRRERTDSPLQALILLNGIQYVEAARVLGENTWQQHAGDVAAIIDTMCLRCLSRQPDEQERQILTQLYAEQRQHYADRPEEAIKLLQTGQSGRIEAIPLPDAAAATLLAQALLNHDECVVKR